MIVIFDGECDFCKSSLRWMQLKSQVIALPFQSSDLSEYNLTKSQCAEQVYVIADGKTYAGAAAIAVLLKERGNDIASFLIRSSKGLGEASYRWISAHRSSFPVRALKYYFDRANKKRELS